MKDENDLGPLENFSFEAINGLNLLVIGPGLFVERKTREKCLGGTGLAAFDGDQRLGA